MVIKHPDFDVNEWIMGNKGASAEGEGYLGNVTVYTMTESGLTLQATVKGTKFWVDKELN